METIEIKSISGKKNSIEIIIDNISRVYPSSLYASQTGERSLIVKYVNPIVNTVIINDIEKLIVDEQTFTNSKDAVIAINELSNFHKGGASSANNGKVRLFVDKRGADFQPYPKRIKFREEMTVSDVILSDNCDGASFEIEGILYNEATLIGITMPSEADLIINDLTIASGFDSANLTIVF